MLWVREIIIVLGPGGVRAPNPPTETHKLPLILPNTPMDPDCPLIPSAVPACPLSPLELACPLTSPKHPPPLSPISIYFRLSGHFKLNITSKYIYIPEESEKQGCLGTQLNSVVHISGHTIFCDFSQVIYATYIKISKYALFLL